MTSSIIFAAMTVVGIMGSNWIMRRTHDRTSLSEFQKSCQIIQRIKKEKGLTDREAFDDFKRINPEYLDPKSRILPSEQFPDLGLDECATQRLPMNSAVARLSKEAVLESGLAPSRLEQIVLNEDHQDPYRIFRRHPVIIGYRPEEFMAIMLTSTMLFGFILSGLTAHRLIRRAAKCAGETLEQMKNGNLKARLLINGREPGGIAQKLNEMADEMEKLVTHLRTVEDSRSGMLQELTHDLKTPVASLRGLLETLRDYGDEMTPARKHEFLENSISETFYFSRLVEDLLFISGVTHPHYKSGVQRLNLVELIREETSLYQTQEELTVRIEGPQHADLTGEGLLLKRLIRNALDNATSFAKSQVLIRISSQNAFWLIEVFDDGDGISEKAQSLFGKKRTTRAANLDQNGRISLGLGSVIMRRIAQLYGGDVAIENGAAPFFASGTRLEIRLKA